MLRLALLAPLLLTIGCASGPKGSAVTLPAIGAGTARIVFYRMTNPIASLDQPNILMDGVVIGKSESGYFSYVDIKPGPRMIELKGGEANRISVQAVAGTATYIETAVSATINNFQFTVEQKPASEAKSKISGLNFRLPTGMPSAPVAPPATP